MQLRLISFGLLTSLLIAAPVGYGENPKPEEAIRAMVDAERKFYQSGQEKGTRAAFLAFLADDAIVFRPGPVNGKQAWEKRPETGLDLIWEPTFAAIARSAELGYTTGPAKWRASKSEEKFTGFGQFISIWKKQKDGSWKVVVDCGIENPEPKKKPGALQMSVPKNESPPLSHASPKISDSQQKLVKEAKEDAIGATMAVAGDEIRVFRDGSFPAVGKKAARTLLEQKPGKVSFASMGGGASYAEDLGYSYGTYTLTQNEGSETGYHFHIWQMEGGSGKLVVDWQRVLHEHLNEPQPKEK